MIKRWQAIAMAFAAGASVLFAYNRYEERKHWISLKAFSGGENTKSMKPVPMSVWRYRGYGSPETTHERLEFSIPAAYSNDRSDRSGGPQEEIDLAVHWPTGDPASFHADLEEYNQDSIGWPIEKYRIGIKSRNIPIQNLTEKARIELFYSMLSRDSARSSPHRGKYCGWESFDDWGLNSLEKENPKSGVTSELYFDTLDPKKWRRFIKCGPDMRVCHLHTHYQRFSLEVSFSPLNICKAREFEAQTKSLLDRFLIAHRPPTRLWSKRDEPDHIISGQNSLEWTKQNLNNPNIREAAR